MDAYIEGTEWELNIEARFPEQVIGRRGTKAMQQREVLSKHTVPCAGDGGWPCTLETHTPSLTNVTPMQLIQLKKRR